MQFLSHRSTVLQLKNTGEKHNSYYSEEMIHN